MRKIFFISMVIGICLVNTPAYCEDLPESIKQMVLKDLGFYEPVKVSVPSSSLLQGPSDTFGPGAMWVNKFFVPNGYLKWIIADTSRWPGKEYVLSMTDKLKPYLKTQAEEIAVAKRILKSIDYVNRWKLNGLDTWSFTFTYFLEPILPELPQLDPFKGKGTATLNPATGQWETRFAPDYGSSLGDSTDYGGEYTAWLEKQPAPKPESLLSPEEIEEALTKLRNVHILLTTQKELDQYNDNERKRTSSLTLSSAEAKQINFYMSQGGQAVESNDMQKVVENFKKVLSIDPDNAMAFNLIAVAYVTLNEPNKALPYAVKGTAKFPHPFSFITIASVFAQKGNKKEALFWLDKALKGDLKNQSYRVTVFEHLKSLEPSAFAKYKNDPDYVSLIKRYSNLGYFVTVDGGKYRISGEIFTGKREGRVFKDEKGDVVRDLDLAKKIAEAAWVYENIVKAPGIPNSQRVSAILETHKAVRRYELTQDVLARASVQILAATISGGATLTYTVPAGLTWRVVRDQFVNLKGLLSLTGRQGLEEALSKYQQMESLIGKLKPNHIDDVTAAEIKKLYDSAYGLDLPYSALLTSLMPKKGRELVDKALKDIGDELIRTLPLSDAVLTTREVFDLQGKMDDALKTNPALKEYYEKLNLAKRLKEANEQTITTWAEQAVQYKE